MVDTSSFLSIYNSAPWVFDGLILCIILGVLFRELFKKTRLSADEKKSQTIGGVIGFCMGMMLVGYMEYAGIHLIPDLGPWIIVVLIILFGVLAWTWIDGKLGNKHRLWSALIVAAITVLILVLVLTGVPLFNNRVGSFTGSFIPGGILSAIPATFIFIALLVFLALLILVIVYLVMSLTGAAAGAAPGVPGESWLGRLFGWGGGALKGLAGYGKGAGKWTFGKALEKLPGLGPHLKKLWPFGKPTVDITEQDAEITKKIAELDEAINNATDRIEKAKLISQKIRLILQLIIKSASTIEPKLAQAKEKQCEEYHGELIGLSAELKDAMNLFQGLEISKTLNEAKQKRTEVINAARNLTVAVNQGPAGLQQLIDAVKKIKKEETREYYVDELASINNDLDATAEQIAKLNAELSKSITAVFKDEDLASAISKIGEIVKKMDLFRNLLSDVAGRIKKCDPADADETKSALQQVIYRATDANNFLATFELTELLARLETGLRTMEKALDVYSTKEKYFVNYFEKLQTMIAAKVTEVEGKLTEEAEITTKEIRRYQAKLGAELHEIRRILLAQITVLQTLITSAKGFIGILTKVWKAVTGGAQGELEVRGKQEVISEGASLGEVEFAGKRKGKLIDIPASETEAQKIIVATIARTQEKNKEATDILATGTAQVKKAVAEIKNARNMLAKILEKGKGISAQQRKDMETLLTILNSILSDENELKKWYGLLDSYEKTIINLIVERSRMTKKKERGTIGKVVYALNKLLTDLNKKLENLNAALAFIEKVEREVIEMAVPAPPSSSPSAKEPIEMPVPPRPAG